MTNDFTLFDSTIPLALRAAGFELRECGLNADWCVSALHVEDDCSCHRYDGSDLYILDNEDGTVSLVTRDATRGGDNDEIVTLLDVSSEADVPRLIEIVRERTSETRRVNNARIVERYGFR